MSNAHLNVVNFLVMRISDYLLLALFSLNRINGISELLDFACIMQYSHMKAHKLYKAPRTSCFLSVNPLTLAY